MTLSTTHKEEKMKHIMLDLETMGKTSQAAIIAVGAVKFDITKGILDSFYEVVDLESSCSLGGVIDTSTILWWLSQEKVAKDFITVKGKHISDVLQSFSEWVGDEEFCVWGNGAAFDNAILSSAYLRASKKQPWKFWNDRCYRTLKSLYPNAKLNRVGVHHNALHDATSQAIHLIEILKVMEIKNELTT